jgi:hypothetical protein
MPTRSLATGRANNGDGMAEKYFLSSGDDRLRKTRGDTHHPADTIEIIEDMFKQMACAQTLISHSNARLSD